MNIKQNLADERGFTLIELVVVVTIVAILASIAIPAYQQYVMKARRIEAIKAVEDLVRAREKYFLNNNAYPATLLALSDYGISTYTENNNYKLTMYDTSPGNTFIRATAVSSGKQYADTKCRIFLYRVKDAYKFSWAWDGSWSTNPQPDPCWGAN